MKSYNDKVFSHMQTLTTGISLLMLSLDGKGHKDILEVAGDALEILINRSLALEKERDMQPIATTSPLVDRLYEHMHNLTDELGAASLLYPPIMASFGKDMFATSCDLRKEYLELKK